MLIMLLPAASLAGEDIQIFKDGVEIDAPVAPFIEDGTTYIPIRALIESLGGQVNWHGSTEPFELMLGETKIAMRIDENQAMLNEELLVTDKVARFQSETTYLPLRFVSENFGFLVNWDGVERRVDIQAPQEPLPALGKPVFDAEELSVIGEPLVSLEEMQWWFSENIDGYEELPELYYEIAEYYGIRPDLAIAQAIKETGGFKYGNLVIPEQNNYCGLYATGVILKGTESIYGADPEKVILIEGNHGADFIDPACGVEAHLQHLYAYATDLPLPEGRDVLDPRFNLLADALTHLRGSAPVFAYLGAYDNPNGIGWAYPGVSYGYEIVDLYQGIYDEIAEQRDF
jgi:hypothetical protein